MTPRHATPSATSPGLALGVVTLAVASAAAEPSAAPPEWVKIAPSGEVTTRDGRHFSFDPQALVARFQAEAVDLPVDFNHGIIRAAGSGQRTDAIGWIKELQARADGLYARVDWLPPAVEALAARTHRYVSPTFTHTPAGAAVWIHSVSLVSAPALAMPALAAADPSHHPEQIMPKAIAQALGLAETADEAACLSAITTLTTGAAGKVDKAVHDQALANLAAANDKLAAAEAKLVERELADHQAKVDAVLDTALKDKKIVPAQREKYAALCATADGLAHVTALLAATPAGLQPSSLDSKPAPTGDAGKPDDLLAKAHVLIDTAAKAGRTLSLADAVVQANGGIA